MAFSLDPGTLPAIESDNAYMDGVHAGCRSGPYTGFKTEPMCPYAAGTLDHAEWYKGLTDALDDLAEGNFNIATHLMTGDSA